VHCTVPWDHCFPSRLAAVDAAVSFSGLLWEAHCKPVASLPPLSSNGPNSGNLVKSHTGCLDG
jgi:hypothetical protein